MPSRDTHDADTGAMSDGGMGASGSHSRLSVLGVQPPVSTSQACNSLVSSVDTIRRVRPRAGLVSRVARIRLSSWL
jgi:hypothetical protein